MQNTTVLVSGAGIAGTATAYWLHRHGFSVTVVERAPELRTGGYKIDVRGAAVDVVDRMGILAEVGRAGTDMRGASFVNSAGKRVATMDAELFGGRSGGDVEIMRGDLNRILFDRTEGDVEYLFDDSITSVTDGADGVRVRFERSPARTFDLVVGADGLHSTTRALVFGEQSRLIHDLGHHVAIFSVPNHLDLDGWELTYPRPGRTAMMYGTRHDMDATAMFLFASPPLDYDRHDPAQQQKLLADAFAGEGWEVPRLLGSMATAPDFYFDSLSQIRMDHWSTGRAVLVGDAAYGASPASGQGTSLALVGAYVLAGELSAASGDHRTAFHRYQHEMRAFVVQNQDLAPNNLKGMVMQKRWHIALQLQAMRILPHLPGSRRIIERVTNAIHAAAAAITLRSY